MPKRTAHIFEEKWRSDDVKLQEATSFSSFLLPERILLGLKKSGFKDPSPIQVVALPPALFGCDVVVQAKSGTGKTLVFTIAALDVLSVELKFPQVLIVAPTREIAFQICDVVKAVGCATHKLNCCTFIGGIPIETDFLNMQGCQIIVGTPGRITQLIELKIFKPHSIRLIVLDEADQLLDASFKSAMDTIFESLPENRQTIAASATYPKSLAKLVNVYFRINPSFARLNETDLALLGITHYTCLIQNTKMPVLAYTRKLQALETILTSVKFSQCLVFCNQVSRVEALCDDIKKFGFSVTFISSAKDQAARLKAIDCLKRFKCKILVSSDLTSRGIDAENVDLIINLDVPYTTEVYLHRVGRAGRYGSKGAAITLVAGTEMSSFTKIQKQGKFTSYDLPEPVPEKLISLRPKNKKSSLSENLNNSTIIQNNETFSNLMENDTLSVSNSDDQNTSSGDSVVDQNMSSKHLAFDNNTYSEAAVNQNTSSEESALNQDINSENSALNQSTSSEDSDVNQSTSSEDSSVNQNTSSEADSVNRSITSEDTSLHQSTSSKDISMNQSVIYEDASINQNICSNTNVNQNFSFKETLVDQNIDSKEKSSKNTVLSAFSVVGNEGVGIVNEDPDKLIDCNIGDVHAVNSKDFVSADEVDKKCVLNKCKKKKSKKRTGKSKQNKSTSPAVSSSEQNCLDVGGEGIGDSLSEHKMKIEECTDEIIVSIMSFIDDYEKNNTAALVNNRNNPSFMSSTETSMRISLIDYYYKVFQAYKSDFIEANGIEQLERLMFVNKETSDEKKDGECATVHIQKGKLIVDQINLSLLAKQLGCSAYSTSDCTDDLDIDSSAEDILVSTPNASSANNTHSVVSSDTPPFPNSVDYQDTSGSSGSKYSSKCLEIENCLKNKSEMVNVKQMSEKPKSKEQKVVTSDTEFSSESKTTSCSDTDSSAESEVANNMPLLEELYRKMVKDKNKPDDENGQNIKRQAANKKQASKHFENAKSKTQNMESSGSDSSSESETTSCSDTDSLAESKVSNNKPLLERAYREMVKGNNKPQTLHEQVGQLKQILLGIYFQDVKSGKGADNDSLSDIQVATVGAHSSRKSFISDSSSSKPSMKCQSTKISRNATCSSGSSSELKGQRNKYQSNDQDQVESVSCTSNSKSSQQRKVSKLTKSKTCQKASGFPSQLNRNEGLRDAERNNLYFSPPQTSRHAIGSHLNHQYQFQNQSNDQDQVESVSCTSNSKSSQQRKESKLTKSKTRQKASGFPSQLNRNEGLRDAERNNLYFSPPQTSRHATGSHLNQQYQFQNAGYPRTGHNTVSRPSQYPCHHSYYNNHAHSQIAAYAAHNSSFQPSQCHHSPFNHQNAIRPIQGCSRSTQHCHNMNSSSAVHPMSSASSVDMYYRQWYWIQHAPHFL